MERPDYWRAAIAGVIATYVMSVAAQWTTALGLPRADPSRLMAYSFGNAPYAVGLFAHGMNGLILALMYARWQRLVPGKTAWIKGIWVGLITALVTQMLVGPLVGPSGFFWTKPNPVGQLLTSLIAHLAYGLVLAVGYSREGEG